MCFIAPQKHKTVSGWGWGFAPDHPKRLDTKVQKVAIFLQKANPCQHSVV